MINSEFVVRLAKGDEDVIAIFRFLVFVAQPVLLAPIDGRKALVEINRIVYSAHSDNPDAFAWIAEIDGEIVGTLGIVSPDWWYADARFLTDRWNFVFPQLANSGIGAALQAEAAAMASTLGLDLIINGKFVRRNRRAGPGVVYTSPAVIHPTSH
jgi:GNAT superfamily N-acetyltransferase